jgi:hypothetical protein
MTSPADTTVKVFHSDMAGAPVLTGAKGSLVALLDACLVNGFGLKTLTSLVISGGVATAAFSGTHPADVDAVVTIAGATPATLDGEHKVVSVGTGTVSFAVSETDQTATGVITMKLASAGWEKRFTGTNLAVYRSLDMAGLRFNYRVNDTATFDARIIGYETMTTVSAGTGLFPTSSQVSGGLWLLKAYNDTTTPISWIIFANGKRVYLCNTPLATANYSPDYKSMQVHGFGEFLSLKSTVDSYANFVTGGVSANAYTQVFGMTGTNSNIYFARASTGVSGAISGYLLGGSQGQSDLGSGENSAQGELPGITGKLRLVNPAFSESGANAVGAGLRGTLNEIFHTPQGILQSVNLRKLDIVPGAGANTGRKLMVVPAMAYGGDPLISVYSAATFFDVTGPWE